MTSKPTSAQLVLKITSFILRLLLNILFYTIVVILIIRASKMTYDFSYEIFGQVTASEEPGREIEIQISKGESTMNVAGKLEFNKLIVNKYSFYVKAKLLKHTIMPGTYALNTSMTYDEIFAIITEPSVEETDSTSENTGSAGKTENKEKENSTESDEEDVTQDTDTAEDN